VGTVSLLELAARVLGGGSHASSYGRQPGEIVTPFKVEEWGKSLVSYLKKKLWNMFAVFYSAK